MSNNIIDMMRGAVDMHVHIVGKGAGGTGCWLRVKGWHWPMAAFMTRHIGVSSKAFSGDFDRLYVERLLELVRASSLEAAVILAHDEVYDDRGAKLDFGSFYVPNDYVLKLADEHPEFIAAVSIHPGRADALEELDRCVARGAAMMKCLPNCHNIDCANPRYTKFWEQMAEARLPLLAHTGGEHTVPVIRKEYSDPRRLRRPLEIGVTVIAAHCATKSGLTDPDYFSVFAAMTKEFPNLYGDVSAFNVPIRGRHIPECLQEPLLSRMLHGSDFPVPVFGHWAWKQGFVPWSEFRRCEGLKNVVEKDYQLKRAMGFPDAVFTRVWDIMRVNKNRASRFRGCPEARGISN